MRHADPIVDFVLRFHDRLYAAYPEGDVQATAYATDEAVRSEVPEPAVAFWVQAWAPERRFRVATRPVVAMDAIFLDQVDPEETAESSVRAIKSQFETRQLVETEK